MVKLVFVIRRRQELSSEEFHRYWLEEHGPLARRLLDSLGARRYVQMHTTGGDLNAALAAPRGTAEAYDGIAEIWWDSLDAFIAAALIDGANKFRAAFGAAFRAPSIGELYFPFSGNRDLNPERSRSAVPLVA